MGVAVTQDSTFDWREVGAQVTANTSTRYVGGVSAQDAAYMARNMNCSPEFIMQQRKFDDASRFATYVRGYTEKAAPLSVPLGILDATPKMDQIAYSRATERNRLRLTAPSTTPVYTAPVAGREPVRPEPVDVVQPPVVPQAQQTEPPPQASDAANDLKPVSKSPRRW